MRELTLPKRLYMPVLNASGLVEREVGVARLPWYTQSMRLKYEPASEAWCAASAMLGTLQGNRHHARDTVTRSTVTGLRLTVRAGRPTSQPQQISEECNSAGCGASAMPGTLHRYRGSTLIRKRTPPEPYRRPMSRVLGGS